MSSETNTAILDTDVVKHYNSIPLRDAADKLCTKTLEGSDEIKGLIAYQKGLYDFIEDGTVEAELYIPDDTQLAEEQILKTGEKITESYRELRSGFIAVEPRVDNFHRKRNLCEEAEASFEEFMGEYELTSRKNLDQTFTEFEDAKRELERLENCLIAHHHKLDDAYSEPTQPIIDIL